jgi:dipeptidyl aminopeptidase/acylaminoacyl peptidase
MRANIRVAVVFVALAVCSVAKAKHPITFEDLMKIQRVSDPHVSPDGQWVAFVVTNVDLEANKNPSHIWLIPAGGGEPRQLTRGEGSDSRPRWSPDGQSIAFVSSRAGKSQVWIIPVAGGEAHSLTSVSTEADGVVWARKAGTLLFTSQVYPDCANDDCNRKRWEEAERSKVKARIIDQLLFRHWDAWRDGKYTHLFSVSVNGGSPRELTPGAYDAPTFFLGAPDGYAVSPDGQEVCYTSNRSIPPTSVAWTTNNHLYLMPASGGQARDITPGVHGSDASPQYSPDGRYIAFTAQQRNGYESDLFQLKVYDRQTGETQLLTPNFDQWVNSFAWAPDSNTIFFTAPERGVQPIFRTAVGRPVVRKVASGFNDELQVSPDGQWLTFTRSTLTQATEIFRVSTSGSDQASALTHINDALVDQLDMSPSESVITKGAGDADIHSLLVKPPAFDPSRKYAALILIHGGPQSAWEDAWSYRWNAQMFAAHGYVVMMTNYHGSTGYGQKFVESISGNWGGMPYEDLMKATEHLGSLPLALPPSGRSCRAAESHPGH